jgi:hypothetical protein
MLQSRGVFHKPQLARPWNALFDFHMTAEDGLLQE